MISEAKKAYMKEYRQRNKEKIAKQRKSYRENNKIAIHEYDKVYREEHKEQIQTYREEHREYINEYRKTDAYKKSMAIGRWKYRGVIHDDFDSLYDLYLKATHCDICHTEFKDETSRCLDHDHDTGKFRQILCRDCNIQDRWKLKNNILDKYRK